MSTPQKRPPGRPRLPLELILDTAVTIVDEQGADALTLRALANRLSSGTATIYRHVANRSELVGLVIDRIIGEADLDEDDIAQLRWDEACTRVATSMFEVLSRHGRAAPLLGERIPTGPNGLAARELLLGVFLRAGCEPLEAVRIVATLSRFVLGFASQSPDSGSAEASDEDVERLRHLDTSRFPVTASVAHLLPRPLAEEFAFGLDLVIRGLRAKDFARKDLSSTESDPATGE